MGNSPSTLSDREINAERNRLRALCKYKNRFGEVFTPVDLKTRRNFLNKFYDMEKNLTGYEHDEIMKIFLKVNNRLRLEEEKKELGQMKNIVEKKQEYIRIIQSNMNNTNAMNNTK
jgi:hypothetical protein